MHYVKLDEAWCASAKQSKRSKALEIFRAKRTEFYSLGIQEFDPLQYVSFGSGSLLIASFSGIDAKIDGL
jgi:hypothetical protein